MIAIVDYGMGNIHSVDKALRLYGAQTVVTNRPEEISSCEKVVLPGVGAFGDAMQELQKQGLVAALKESIQNKKPFLGICLGMQLLFEGSVEARKTKGLGILKGKVLKFAPKTGLKVPHMGWNQLKVEKSPCLPAGRKAECPLLEGIADNSFVYFCHSYYPEPRDKKIIAATTDYGKDFASLVWQENIFGAQFHPEKSQSVGLKILENFIKLC